MLSLSTEKKLLQILVACVCLVPLSAGTAGALLGPGLVGGADLDSHFRYLSGLLLGIGIGFLLCIPRIEEKTKPIRLLTMIVAIGGMVRLVGIFLMGFPSMIMLAGLGMELVITPLLCLWQHRFSQKFYAPR